MTHKRSLSSPSILLAISVILVAGLNIWNMLHLDIDSSDARLATLLSSSFAYLNGTNGSNLYPSAPSPVPPIDLVKMTEYLIESFTGAERGMPTIAPRQFPRLIVSTKNEYLASHKCQCDLLEVDCLDAIACLPTNDHHRNALIHLGMETRKALQQTATFMGDVSDSPYAPIGKGHQYAAMAAWTSWAEANILPKKYDQTEKHDFVNETLYEYCQDSHRNGKSCFFSRINDPEDVQRGLLEKQASQWFSRNNYGDEEVEKIRQNLQTFLNIHRPQLQEVHEARDKALEFEKSHSGVTLPTSSMSPLGQLMMFSHIVRLLFQLRPFLYDIYEDRLKTVIPKQRQEQEQHWRENEDALSPFRVSLHMRRGDSCHFDEDRRQMPYETVASSLHSPAQTSNVRKCYQTEVYLQQVERIRELLPKDQQLHVYLSTDDTGSVMKEIEANHTHVYNNVVDQWHFLDYSRSHFQYDLTEFIESDANQNRPMMGEAAVTDLWLLSHGQAYIGHLGSRFGKVAWYLATSRHNSFIPFFSVDGHSVCCEIDEACGSARKYIFDMENCLTFSHEYLNRNVGDSYWELGSLARKSEYRHSFRLKRHKKDEPQQEQG